MARVYEKDGNPDAAIEMREQAIKVQEAVSPESSSLPVSYNNLGTLYYETKNYEAAAKSYRKAIQVQKKQDAKSENLVTYRTNLANTKFAQGVVAQENKDFEGAIKHIKEALTLREQCSAGQDAINACNKQLGCIYEAQGDLVNAKVYLGKVASESASLGVLSNNAGTLSFNKGEYEDALKHYEEAIQSSQETNPEYLVTYQTNLANTHYALGDVFQKGNKLDEAIGHFEKAVVLNAELPERGEETKVCHDRLGAMYEAQGKNKKALEHFEAS